MDRSPLNEEEREARRQLADLLRRVLSGRCSYLEAVPQVVHLRSWLGGIGDFDNDFRVFVEINSETDHLPTQATRHLWAEHAVKALDPEIAKLESWAADLAGGSCKALLARFAETGLRGRGPFLTRYGSSKKGEIKLWGINGRSVDQ